jgi:hypothetical protein
VSAHGQARVRLTASQPSETSGRQRSRSGLARGAYCVEAGITSTAAGAWASLEFSGPLKAVVWIGVTAALAAAAVWLAEPAVAVLDRCLPGTRR